MAGTILNSETKRLPPFDSGGGSEFLHVAVLVLTVASPSIHPSIHPLLRHYRIMAYSYIEQLVDSKLQLITCTQHFIST